MKKTTEVKTTAGPEEIPKNFAIKIPKIAEIIPIIDE